MRMITEKKPLEELLGQLGGSKSVFLLSCGTCPVLCRTGGKEELLEMEEQLKRSGRDVTGWTIVPTACDELTREALDVNSKTVGQADAVVVLSCAIGAQMVSRFVEKLVLPALNTMFLGTQIGPGEFIEVCRQCGLCVIGETGGICPITRCAKNLLNGPCGGSQNGRCEVSPDIPCGWQLIYDRLKALGALESLQKIMPAKDWSVGREIPGRIILEEES